MLVFLKYIITLAGMRVEAVQNEECHKPDREGRQMVAKPEERNRLEGVLGTLEHGMEVEQ